jgi:hypothetical protein
MTVPANRPSEKMGREHRVVPHREPTHIAPDGFALEELVKRSVRKIPADGVSGIAGHIDTILYIHMNLSWAIAPNWIGKVRELNAFTR